MIWASLLEVSGPLSQYEQVALVSSNTTDFAGPDKESLKEELARDLEGGDARIVYYPSLDSFLKQRAEPVQHITKEWVLERLDTEYVDQVMTGWVYSKQYERPIAAARPSWDNLLYYYEPNETIGLELVERDFQDFYVWQFDDGHLELRLRFFAKFIIDNTSVLHENALYPSEGLYYPGSGLYPNDTWQQRHEQWEVEFSFTARIDDDSIVDVGFEEPLLIATSYW